MLSGIRVIIFDWGGTLCHVAREADTPTLCAREATVFLSRNGLAVEPGAKALLLSLGAEAVGQAGQPPEHLEVDTHAVLRTWMDRLDIRVSGDGFIETLAVAMWKPWIGCLDCYAGVHEALRDLAERGYVLGLLSNVSAPPEVCIEHLRHLGLFDLLDFTEFSSGIGRRKPHPATYEAALTHARRLCPGIGNSDVLFVGDTPKNDIAGPAAIGMRTALIVGDDAPADVRADVCVARVADLPARLPANPPNTTTR